MVKNLHNPQDIPLVVDLDGTLLKTELPWESFLAVLVSRPLGLIKILTHRVLHGNRVSLKRNLEKHAALELKTLPLSESFLNFLKSEKSKGRTLFLCTGSTQSYADRISQNIPLFKEAFGSLTGNNLVGKTKATFLKARFKEKGFDYAGNALVDLKVAREARKFIVVNPSLSLLFAKKTSQYQGVFSSIVKFFYNKHQSIPWDKTFKDKQKTFSQLVWCAGGGLWILNSSFYFLFSSHGIVVFGLGFLASGFYMFFLMSRLFLDRSSLTSIKKPPKNKLHSFFFYWAGLKKSSGYHSNMFARGDLSLETGFFIVGVCLSLAAGFLIGSIYEQLPHISYSHIRFPGFSWESKEPLTIAAHRILSLTCLSLLYVGGIYLWLYRMHFRWKVASPLAVLIFIFVPFGFF